MKDMKLPLTQRLHDRMKKARGPVTYVDLTSKHKPDLHSDQRDDIHDVPEAEMPAAATGAEGCAEDHDKKEKEIPPDPTAADATEKRRTTTGTASTGGH